ncbi:FHA domain-containing protein [Microbulbifer spongiae]|uniref:FHA domain-containing protein n=1 Tax=Microbulbifer spongiae TaxID=2944933 RepID=A0ABY9EE63_9GAMM|nr:FHA domain-containing protein [Microbulbifer sp. MI-G]WKD51323.1 FHA domain-containing protein [Microbulbifer sp. MI-G]
MLKLCDVQDPSQSVWLVSPGVTVGRAQSCDLCLPDDSVAKLHLKIVVKEHELMLDSVSSGSQILVNGKVVAMPHRLQLNDQLTVGTRILRIIDPKVTRLKAAPAKSVAWALRANHRAIAGKVFPVKGGAVVGRSEECDITFSLSHLSRRHARLEVREGLLFVIDLGSANGTFVNNRRVAESRVRRGDELRFDTLRFSVVGPPDDIDRTAVRPAVSMAEVERMEGAVSAGAAPEDITRPSAVVDGLHLSGGVGAVEVSGARKTRLRAWAVALLLGTGAAGLYWADSQGFFG